MISNPQSTICPRCHRGIRGPRAVTVEEIDTCVCGEKMCYSCIEQHVLTCDTAIDAETYE